MTIDELKKRSREHVGTRRAEMQTVIEDFVRDRLDAHSLELASLTLLSTRDLEALTQAIHNAGGPE